MNDPIVDEVRRVRGEHAARFNYDLWAIFQDIQEQQKRSGLKFVSFADEADLNKPLHPTGVAISAAPSANPLEVAPAGEL